MKNFNNGDRVITPNGPGLCTGDSFDGTDNGKPVSITPVKLDGTSKSDHYHTDTIKAEPKPVPSFVRGQRCAFADGTKATVTEAPNSEGNMTVMLDNDGVLVCNAFTVSHLGADTSAGIEILRLHDAWTLLVSERDASKVTA